MSQICIYVCYSSIYLGKEPSCLCYYQFFKQIRTGFVNKPIYTDEAHWYNDACKWLRLKHIIIYRTELKNIMARVHSAYQR
jgi:hypothetical protein